MFRKQGRVSHDSRLVHTLELGRRLCRGSLWIEVVEMPTALAIRYSKAIAVKKLKAVMYKVQV